MRVLSTTFAFGCICICICCCVLVPSLTLTAQEQPPDDSPAEQGRPPVRVGLGLWGTMNLHQGDFTSYDGILECGTFDEATTIGLSVGYLFEFPLSSSFSIHNYFLGGNETLKDVFFSFP